MDSVTNFFWNEEELGEHAKRPSQQKASQHTPATYDFSQSKVVFPKKEVEDKSSSTNEGANGVAKKNSGPGKGKSLNNMVIDGVKDPSSSLQQMMTDTLVEKIIKMALPPTSDYSRINIEERTVFSKTRPSMSVQVMSNNFIQMNSRLSIPFIMINEVILLMSWENIPYTLSILLVFTFAILKPLVTLTAGPLFYILFGVMVPKYMYVHKPNIIEGLKCNNTPAQGPPLRKPVIPEPVPELSQEFVLNLTDLQNHMLLYVWLYDAINSSFEHFAYFVNEQISCLVFIILLFVALINLLYIEDIVKWIPLKFVLVLAIWAFAIMMHPKNRELILKTLHSEDTRLRVLTLVSSYESFINQHLRYVEAKEVKMVSVYEIQKYREKYKEWRTVGFSTDDYCLFSDLRIKEQDISQHCAKLLDDVLPPIDWEWQEGSSWVLDLNPNEWVEDNFIQNVDIDTETKWVYDVDFDGFRGKYRRRRWNNTVARVVESKENRDASTLNIDDEDNSQFLEEVVNPLREEMANNSTAFHGVARGSLVGAHNSSMVSEDTAEDDSISGYDHSDRNGSVNGIDDMVDILNTAI